MDMVTAGKRLLASLAMLYSDCTSIGSAPQIFGNGCYINDVTGSFWIFHTILLLNETSAQSPYNTMPLEFSLFHFQVMLTLILIKAYSATKHETGHFLSRGYRLIAYEGILYYVLVTCKNQVGTYLHIIVNSI